MSTRPLFIIITELVVRDTTLSVQFPDLPTSIHRIIYIQKSSLYIQEWVMAVRKPVLCIRDPPGDRKALSPAHVPFQYSTIRNKIQYIHPLFQSCLNQVSFTNDDHQHHLQWTRVYISNCHAISSQHAHEPAVCMHYILARIINDRSFKLSILVARHCAEDYNPYCIGLFKTRSSNHHQQSWHIRSCRYELTWQNWIREPPQKKSP